MDDDVIVALCALSGFVVIVAIVVIFVKRGGLRRYDCCIYLVAAFRSKPFKCNDDEVALPVVKEINP